MRLPVEIVKAVRAAVRSDFILIYRLSMLDLVKDGSDWEEVPRPNNSVNTTLGKKTTLCKKNSG